MESFSEKLTIDFIIQNLSNLIDVDELKNTNILSIAELQSFIENSVQSVAEIEALQDLTAQSITENISTTTQNYFTDVFVNTLLDTPISEIVGNL